MSQKPKKNISFSVSDFEKYFKQSIGKQTVLYTGPFGAKMVNEAMQMEIDKISIEERTELANQLLINKKMNEEQHKQLLEIINSKNFNMADFVIRQLKGENQD